MSFKNYLMVGPSLAFVLGKCDPQSRDLTPLVVEISRLNQLLFSLVDCVGCTLEIIWLRDIQTGFCAYLRFESATFGVGSKRFINSPTPPSKTYYLIKNKESPETLDALSEVIDHVVDHVISSSSSSRSSTYIFYPTQDRTRYLQSRCYYQMSNAPC